MASKLWTERRAKIRGMSEGILDLGFRTYATSSKGIATRSKDATPYY